MGLFDKLVGDIIGKFAAGQGGDGLGSVLRLVTGKDGGLAGLVNQFAAKGLGDIVQSWVGTGNNLPISQDQIQQALGSGRIGEIAQKLGISPEQASAQLAEWLPKAVDTATPNGRIEPSAENR